MTIADCLQVQERSISQREAEIFLQEALGVGRSYLYTHPEQVLSTKEQTLFLSWTNRREQNEPVAYIIGHKEFYGRSFLSDKRALIPRPETEGLIDKALSWLPDYFKASLAKSNKPCPLNILELGTGCGIIAITLALELSERHIPVSLIATDIAQEALDLAQENWQILQKNSAFSRISFIQADLCAHPEIKKAAPFDFIIANLPYVPTAWQQDPAAQAEVVFHEPDIALFGGEDGLAIYRRFFAEVTPFLGLKGRMLLEFGEEETAAIHQLATSAFPAAKIEVFTDYANLDRILEIRLD